LNWATVLRCIVDRFTNDRLMAVAAGVTFYALLAIFPALAALVSLYALIADPTTIQSHLDLLSSIVPGGAMQIITEQVNRIASKGVGELGFGFALGLLVSLWSANAGMKAMFDALNIVYRAKEKRGFFRLNLVSLTFTLGMIIFTMLALIGIVGVPLAVDYFGLKGVGDGWVSVARWPALLVIVAVVLALLYRFGPCRPDTHLRWISPGSAIASLMWLAASAAFSWYAANFGSYNQTYGTLGAAVGMMTWIWISLNVVLVGGEVNAQFDSQTRISDKPATRSWFSLFQTNAAS
jgi:membrane protein